MKKIFILFIILSVTNAQPGWSDFVFDGLTRQYYLHLPNELGSVDGYPLVFVLHGLGGNASGMIGYSQMNQVANDNGFAVVYPNGTFDQGGIRFWNVGYEIHFDETVDDVGFLVALAQFLQTEYNLDPDRIFSTGFSNGGDMCYLLGCEASDVFKAVAPVAGCLMEWITESCSPQNPISLFEIHGTQDNVVWWDGDLDNIGGWGPYLSTLQGIEFWSEMNNCTESTSEFLPNLNPNDGSIVISHQHSGCSNSTEVWLYEVNGGGHDWPGSSGNMDINSSEEIWEFFDNQNTIMNVDYLSGWNLVGLPLETDDSSYISLFPESIEGTLYSFSEGYVPETHLSTGSGYWLRFPDSGSTTITGTPINDLTISLNEGWNLISGITNSINVSDIQDLDGIIIPGTVFGFTPGGYSNVESLEPGKGYWIRTVESGLITLMNELGP